MTIFTRTSNTATNTCLGRTVLTALLVAGASSQGACGDGQKNSVRQVEISGTSPISAPFTVGDKQLSLEIPDPSIFPPGSQAVIEVADHYNAVGASEVGLSFPVGKLTISFADSDGYALSPPPGHAPTRAGLPLDRPSPFIRRTATPTSMTGAQQAQVFMKRAGKKDMTVGVHQSPYVDYGSTDIASTLDSNALLQPYDNNVYYFPPPVADAPFAPGSTTLSMLNTVTQSMPRDHTLGFAPMTSNGGIPYTISSLPTDVSNSALLTTAISPVANALTQTGAVLHLRFDAKAVATYVEQLQSALGPARVAEVNAVAFNLRVTSHDCTGLSAGQDSTTISRVLGMASGSTPEFSAPIDFSEVLDRLPAFTGEKCVNYQNQLRFGTAAAEQPYSIANFPFALQQSVTGLPLATAEVMESLSHMPGDLELDCNSAGADWNNCMNAAYALPSIRIFCTDTTKTHCTLTYLQHAPVPVPVWLPKPSITLSAVTGNTTEIGTQATFTVQLGRPPVGVVALNVASSDPAMGTAAPVQLVFTPSNWNLSQTVKVTGASTAPPDATRTYVIQLAVNASTTDTSGYAGQTINPVSVTHVGAAILLGSLNGMVIDASSNQPLTGVTVAVHGSPLSVQTGADGSFLLAFLPPGSTTLDFTLSGYRAGSANATVVAGQPTALGPTRMSLSPGVLVSATSGITSEGGARATFTVQLKTKPSGVVVINVTSSDPTQGIATPSPLQFTTSTWNRPQTVTVTGIDDATAASNQNYSILLTVDPSTADTTGYQGLAINPVAVTHVKPNANFGSVSGSVLDASTNLALSGVTVALHGTALSTTTASNGSYSLGALPPGAGTIDFTKTGYGFTSASVTIVAGRTTPLGFTRMSPPPAITVSTISGNTGEDGTQATFTVQLTTPPTGNVVINISSTDTTEGIAAQSQLIFTPSSWKTPKTVIVFGVSDAIMDGDQNYSIRLAVDPSTADTSGYASLILSPVAVTNLDTTPRLGSIGGTVVDVSSSEPLSEVTVAVHGSLLSTTTGSDGTFTLGSIPAGAATIDFTKTGYRSISTSVTITAGLSTDLATTILSPPPGVTVSDISGNTNESGTEATFTVQLVGKPDADVVIDVTSSDTTEGTVSPAQLLFSTSDWDTPQTVTVTGVSDALVDGNQNYSIRLAVATSTEDSTGYADLTLSPVSVTNVDSTPNIGSASGTVVDVSTGDPLSGVTVTLHGTAHTTTTLLSGFYVLHSLPPGAGTIDFTKTGYHDVATNLTIVAAQTTVLGTTYMTPPPGTTVSAISGHTSEDGTQATFTIRLIGQPDGNVVINIASSDTTEGTVSPAQLVFTHANFATPRTVTVTGVDDVLADGDTSYHISLTVDDSTADTTGYADLTIDDVAVINDDTTPP